ncbi:MAG: zf-HC2 domain-containing protein [Betaproteobacteria bacterium]|nr:zf-HC2 domain-containing protein [Betaproteobacteria bacterium]
MGKLMYSCEQAAKLSSRAMEKPLARLDRSLLSLHSMMCTNCTNFTRQIAFFRRASRKIPEALDKAEG